jgi:anti-sigma regulatory factor (Ser/Thr protein kinase)
MSKAGDTGRWLRQLLTPSKEGKDLNREHLGDPDIHVVLRAKYLYIAYVRDLCESLALDMGFSEDDAFGIKLVVDEIVTNAFEHGCTHPGNDKIEVKVSFAGTGIFISVRDPGGKVFDHRKYRGFEANSPDSIGSGLCLIDKFTDEWVVNAKTGEYTEVMAFKKKSDKEGT